MAQSLLVNHTFGGIVGICIGLWWMCNALRLYFLAKLLPNSNYKYRNTPTYPCPCAPTKQIEGWVKTLLSFVGMFNELNWGDPDHNVLTGRYVQHAMLWTFFCFNGVVDLLTHHFPRMIPRHLDDVALALAIFMKYWIFSNHTHGKDLFENTIHAFLLPLDLGAAVVTILGIVWKDSPIPPFLRSVTFIIAGTWIIQVAWILYPPSGIMTWERTDPDQLMLVAGLFTLHIALGLFFSLLILILVYWRTRTYIASVHLPMTNVNGQKVMEAWIDNGHDKVGDILTKMNHIS